MSLRDTHAEDCCSHDSSCGDSSHAASPPPPASPVRLTLDGCPSFEPNEFDLTIARHTGSMLRAMDIRTVQLNVGLRCNLACHHCHVESGPKRNEEMSWDVMLDALEVAQRAGARTIDITGGAPEMNPCFKPLVARARSMRFEVIVRTNLTIVLEPGYADLPDFFRSHNVHLVASLPCYLEVNVDRQRGRHVYSESIEVIRRLNALGFGIMPDLELDLVYNPGGPSLPPDQHALEQDYRRELERQFGLKFTRLYTITNMPIGRFQRDLERAGRADAYLSKLRNAFNPSTIDALMCRHQIHVAYDGTLSDCDFNFALKLGVNGTSPKVRDLLQPEVLHALTTRPIATAPHCFACTAGCGSSCTGSLT